MEDAMSATVLNAEPKKTPSWCLDNAYVCMGRDKFDRIDNKVCAKVYTVADHCVTSTGAGDVKLKVKLRDGQTNFVKLEDTMYIPDFRNNSLSESHV